MAYVTEIFKIEATGSGAAHKECACGWRVSDRHGQKVLQLDTYGAADRKIPGKVSQTLQFDRERASELLALIRQTFPGID